MSEIFDIASHHDYNEGALVNLDGTVVVSHDTDLWDPLKSTSLVNISDTYFLPPGTFEELTAQWNFDQEWSPDYMDKKVHSNAVLKKSDGVFASLPIPLPPRQYDPLYRPSYYLFLRIDREIFSAIDEVDEAVEDDVEKVVITAILIGVVGLALVALVIWLVARSLTLPLGWMQRVAWRIVNHNDERAGGALDVTKEEEDSRMFVRCTPRTEITDLVSEFRMMIKCFSGEGSSTVAKKNRTEVHNEMRWRSEFFQLYSRLESRTILKNSNGENDEACTDTSTTVTSLSPSIGVDTSVGGSTIAKESAPPISTKTPHTKLNMGRHCISISDQVEEERLKSEIRNDLKRQRTKVRQSRLFWWIVILIVLPLLITFLAIGGVVVHAILNVFPSWLETLESASYDIEVGALLQTASLRASFSRAVMTEPLRDIHIFNRLVSWLLFGVVQVKGVTSMKSETEDCKYFEFNECPLYNDPQKSICDCLWKDPRDWLSCWDYPDSMRNQQHGIFCGQSSDADPETGNRNNVSYPFHSADPNTTSWWTDFFQMPGAERGALPSGYKTVFDRVGVLSAAAVASVPLYNYIENLDRNKHFLGLYFAFENDGMFQGYSVSFYNLAFFVALFFVRSLLKFRLNFRVVRSSTEKCRSGKPR